jgi:hypothetical protein
MYMIRLKDLLAEYEFGKLLWADPAYASSSGRYRRFIDKAYKGALEKDSPDEALLWMQLQDYLKLNQKDTLDMRAFSELSLMKKRFPAILEPGLKPDDLVYRGMTLPIEQTAELVNDPKVLILPRGEWYFLAPLKRNIESRSEGFISVSAHWNLASGFALGRSPIGRWPIITSTQYRDVAPNAFMNPEFLTTVGGYDEKEFWILGSTLPVVGIHIQSPWISGPVPKTREADVIAEALEARGIQYRG